MINLKDVRYVKIESVLLHVNNITEIAWNNGIVEINVNSDLMQADIKTNIKNVELVTVE
ncbi:MAG: hypothetical protein MRZ48_00100 [Anaerostipes hadrus]|nr:hypothetical protein [Anaerostipes hadrus]